MPEHGPNPDQPQEPEHNPDDVDRLARHLDDMEANEGAMASMSEASRLLYDGVPAAEVITYFGGTEALEGKVGPKMAKRLEDLAVEQELGKPDEGEING